MMVDLIGNCIIVNKQIEEFKLKIMKSSCCSSECEELLSLIIELSNVLSLKQLYIMAIFKQEEINNLTNQQERQKLLNDFWAKHNMPKLFANKLVEIEDLLEDKFSFEDAEECIQKVINHNDRFIGIADKMCEEFDIKVCL